MSFLRNIKISTRLIIGFAAVLLLFIVTTAIGTTEVSRIGNALTQINDLNSVKQRYAINFRGSVHDRAISLRDVVLFPDQKGVDDSIADIKRLEEFYANSAGPLDELVKDSTDDKEHDILSRIKGIEAATMPMIVNVVTLRNSGQHDAAHALLMNEARPQFSLWLKTINEFIDLQEAKNKEESTIARGVASNFTNMMLLVCGVSLLIGLTFAYWCISSIRPLRKLTSVMLQLADGKLDIGVPDDGYKDEVGSITGAVHVFKNNAIKAREQDEHVRTEQQASLQKAEHIAAAIQQFEATIEQVKGGLLGAVSSLDESADHLDQAIRETKHMSEQGLSTASDASQNVNSVASATEQLTTSIQEISRNVADTATSAQTCAEVALQSQDKLNQLKDAVAEIDTIIRSINDVAEQTNLLALNATIEAARAGEAGKGFAVVANEVKTLATQTHKMTADIGEKVDSIKSSAQLTIESMTEILERINQVSEKTNGVAGAIEQQNASTQEISVNVHKAADGTNGVTKNIHMIDEAAQVSATSCDGVKTAASTMKQQADVLQHSVDSFLKAVRMA